MLKPNKKAIVFLASLLLVVAVLLFVGNKVSADNEKFGMGVTAEEAGLKSKTPLTVMVGNIIGTGLSLIGIIFFALMVYGGIKWMTSGGNQTGEKEAMKAIFSAIVGMVVVLSSYMLVNFVLTSSGLQGGNPTMPNAEKSCAPQSSFNPEEICSIGSTDPAECEAADVTLREGNTLAAQVCIFTEAGGLKFCSAVIDEKVFCQGMKEQDCTKSEYCQWK